MSLSHISSHSRHHSFSNRRSLSVTAVRRLLLGCSQVVAMQVADGAVSAAKLASGCVDTMHLLPSSVTTTKIVLEAVTTPTIASLAVTNEKVSSCQVASQVTTQRCSAIAHHRSLTGPSRGRRLLQSRLEMCGRQGWWERGVVGARGGGSEGWWE